MKIRYEIVSDVGRERSNNEDMALVFGAFVRDGYDASMVKMDSKPRFTALVADGMGGYGGGEIASELTLKSFDQFIVNLAPDLSDADVRVAVNNWLDAHKCLMAAEQLKPGLEQMGTTLTGIFTYGDRQYMINAGDSRVYRWRNNTLRQLSVDHSERERRGDSSIPSNLIYNAIGVPGAFINITLLNDRFPMVDDDMYLICSDGLNDMISDDKISEILEQGGGARQLVDAALDAGGRDNCTVILMRVSISVEVVQSVEATVAEHESYDMAGEIPVVPTAESAVSESVPNTPEVIESQVSLTFEVPAADTQQTECDHITEPYAVYSDEGFELPPVPPTEEITETTTKVTIEEYSEPELSFKERFKTFTGLIGESFRVLKGNKKR